MDSNSIPVTKSNPTTMQQSLPPPNSVKTHILNALIKGRVISERDYSFNSFRARLSDLTNKHNLDIQFNWVKFKNAFGHPGMYREHYLPPEEREKAIQEYLKLADGKENIHRVA